jgi:SAM-dependent methyltransferase
VKREWWQSFFRGPWLDFQRTMDRPERVIPVADFLQRELDLPAGARVLDAPCGEGRIARELARRGYRVTGLDLTPGLLRDAERLARRDGLDIEWHRGDMRDLPWRRRFDLALCWWGSFGYFSDSENRRHVKAVARALKPGGRFAIDTHSPETLFPGFLQRQWAEDGGVVLFSRNSYDVDSGRVETEWEFIHEGRRRSARSSIRLYTLRELRELFAAAGFAGFRSYGSLEGDPFELDSRRLVFVARKGRTAGGS